MGLRARGGLVVCAVLGAFLFLAACVPTSENPIEVAGQSPDKSLVGAWRGKLDDGGRLDLHFLRREDGRLVAVFITTGDDPNDRDEWSVFTLVTAEVRGTRYLSALWDFDDGKTVTGRDRGYHLMRYVLGPDGSLALFGVNEKKLMKAVKSGKLQGVIEGKDKEAKEVRVTAPSDQLVAYLEKTVPADLFDTPFARLTRSNPN